MSPEGGEVAYNHSSDDLAREVLHIADWTRDECGDLQAALPAHTLLSSPNPIAAPVGLTYGGYGDQDGVITGADASQVCVWSNFAGEGALVAFDANPDPTGGQLVYLPFSYTVLADGPRQLLLQNAIVWLMAFEEGDCIIAGTAILSGHDKLIRSEDTLSQFCCHHLPIHLTR